MRRRDWLLGSAAASVAGLGSYAGFIEPRWWEVTRHRVAMPGWQGTRTVRLLHLADLHLSPLMPLPALRDAFTLALTTKPDLICLVGDFITTRTGHNLRDYATALRRLAEAAPTYAVLGNHDGGHWAAFAEGYDTSGPVRETLEKAGITLLHNVATDVRHHGHPLRIVGVGDLWSLEVEAAAAFASPAPSGVPTVLLAHNPDTKDIVADRPWHLMLSGHTHGGQVRPPFAAAPIVPVQDKRYVDDLRPWGQRWICVTRGVGLILGVRFLVRPEITVLELGAA